MRKLVLKYLSYSWPDRLLLFYTFILMGVIRFVLLLVPFRYIAAYLGTPIEESPYVALKSDSYIGRVGQAIRIMNRYTPWESKCLVQAITGKLLLRRRRLQNTLYLGVAKDGEQKMIAHAWLRSGDSMVTGGGIDKAFTVVAMFTDVSYRPR